MQAKPIQRRPLNQKQLELLKTLYRFRFATTQLLSQVLHIHQNKIHPRLNLLLEQKYIARKDDAGFRMPGKFATYYLRPEGVNAIPDLNTDPRTKALIRRIGDDATRSDRFIAHCLGVFDIFCDLGGHFGERLRFFTKSDLGPYTYFPRSLPDAFIRLDNGPAEKRYLIDYVDVSVPTRAAMARVDQLSDYADDNDWTTATRTDNPTTIFVVDKPELQKKLQRYITVELDNNPLLQVTSRGEVIALLEAERKAELS
jgi:hypothetical protein